MARTASASIKYLAGFLNLSDLTLKKGRGAVPSLSHLYVGSSNREHKQATINSQDMLHLSFVVTTENHKANGIFSCLCTDIIWICVLRKGTVHRHYIEYRCVLGERALRTGCCVYKAMQV